MNTMNIPSPNTLKSFVDEQVTSGGFSTSADPANELTRKEEDRQQLLSLLLAGMASASASTANSAYFEGLRNRIYEAAKVGAHG
jgi:antitoxin ParD1/3/4